MTSRRSPVRHSVKPHIRNGKQIKSFERGKGSKHQRSSRVVGNTTNSNIIPGTDIEFKWAGGKEINMMQIWMHPDDFLSLVPYKEFPEVLENRFLDTLMPSLSLWMVAEDEVGGHEGRHRAAYLKSQGATSVPVVITYKNSAWNKMGRKLPESINYKGWQAEDPLGHNALEAYYYWDKSEP